MYDDSTLVWRCPKSVWLRYALPVICIVLGASNLVHPTATTPTLTAKLLRFILLVTPLMLILIWWGSRATQTLIALSSKTLAYRRTFSFPRVFTIEELEKVSFTPLILYSVVDGQRKRVWLPTKWMASEEQVALDQAFARRWRVLHGE